MGKEGNWKNTTYFGMNKLPRLKPAVIEAYDYMNKGSRRMTVKQRLTLEKLYRRSALTC